MKIFNIETEVEINKASVRNWSHFFKESKSILISLGYML